MKQNMESNKQPRTFGGSPTAIMMIGIPASGKSTQARKLAEETGSFLISTDSIREELTGSKSDLSRDDEMWDTLEERAGEHLEQGENIIVDATHSSKFSREFYSRYYRTFGAEVVGLFVNTPIETALERNQNRDRFVPEHVIEDMQEKLTKDTPKIDDGFDNIIEL